MILSADCMLCLITRQVQHMDPSLDEAARAEYLRDVMRALLDADPCESAPVAMVKITELHQARFGKPFGFESLKRQYNEKMLSMEAEIAGSIAASPDRLLAALRFARAGNYIDFGALGEVDDEKLHRLLESAGSEAVDRAVYDEFLRDLSGAKTLAYLTDNCGEIVLDKLLITEIRERYPQLAVTVITRGSPVLNDATAEDALAVGLGAVAEVIGNGNGIAGTHLKSACPEARERILAADVVISKGQGNFETMQGCGLNVYYLFLCKCDWFVKRFAMKRHQGVFARERSNRR